MFELVVKLQRYAKLLVIITILLFLILGTVASLPSYAQNQTMYQVFVYSPMLLLFLIPIVLMQLWFLKRLRLIQGSALYMMIAVACIPFLAMPWLGYKSVFYGLLGWLAVSTVLGWQVKEINKFLP